MGNVLFPGFRRCKRVGGYTRALTGTHPGWGLVGPWHSRASVLNPRKSHTPNAAGPGLRGKHKVIGCGVLNFWLRRPGSRRAESDFTPALQGKPRQLRKEATYVTIFLVELRSENGVERRRMTEISPYYERNPIERTASPIASLRAIRWARAEVSLTLAMPENGSGPAFDGR